MASWTLLLSVLLGTLILLSTGRCVREEIIKGQWTASTRNCEIFPWEKNSVENDKRLRLKTLPERDAAANSSTTENCLQTKVRIESYGVTFPDRRNFTSSTSFCLSPNTAEEEEEQLCVAKQLSLGFIPFDNGDNTEQTKEAANILLSFKSSMVVRTFQNSLNLNSLSLSWIRCR